MVRVGLLFALILGSILECPGQEAGVTGRTASLAPILEVLAKENLSGSLEFSGSCPAGYTPDLPALRRASTTGHSAIQTLRELFGGDPAMKLTKDEDGVIRMTEVIPTDILNMRISHASFDGSSEAGKPWAAYNPNAALSLILHLPEVASFMRDHHIELPSQGAGVPGNISGRWSPDAPHISESFENITLSDAMDRILNTFPGMWIYENCPATRHKDREVHFLFVRLQRVGSTVFVVE